MVKISTGRSVSKRTQAETLRVGWSLEMQQCTDYHSKKHRRPPAPWFIGVEKGGHSLRDSTESDKSRNSVTAKVQ